MKKIMILLTIMLRLCDVGNARTIDGRVSGSVTDNRRNPVESATVSLINPKDSSIIKINTTDKKGMFLFDHISNGKYIVSVSILSYQKDYSEIFELTTTRSSVDLKTISTAP
jgi:hypothetical protein